MTTGGGSTAAYGAAISIGIGGTITDSIEGLFDTNTSYDKNAVVFGGAIFNYGEIADINADFTGNEASGNGAKGGGISNGNIISNISGNFVGNSATGATETTEVQNDESEIFSTHVPSNITSTPISDTPTVEGGAIYNANTMGAVSGRFEGNKAESNYSLAAVGGAISNAGNIGEITADFVNNYASSVSGKVYGGAISNHSNSGLSASGSVISVKRQIYTNSETGESITVYYSSKAFTLDEVKNLVDNEGYKISQSDGPRYTISNDQFENLKQAVQESVEKGEMWTQGIAELFGEDAIYYPDFLPGSTTYISDSNFVGNYAYSAENMAYGGAISNTSPNGIVDYGVPEDKLIILSQVVCKNSKGDSFEFYQPADSGYTVNVVQYLVENEGYKVVLESEEQTFTDEAYDELIAYAQDAVESGIIYTGDLGDLLSEDDIVQSQSMPAMSITNSSFINNYAKSDSSEAKGGAIYSKSDIDIISKDGYQTVFRGNYTESNGVKDDNAIYMDNVDSTLSFEMSNGGSVYMADNIDGAIEEQADGTKDAYNVEIIGDDINKTTFHMLNDIRHADLTVGNTTLNTINNQTHTYDFNSFTLNGETNMTADVDLKNETMDRFTANSYGTHMGNLNVSGMNLLSDAPENRDVTEIYFAQVGLKDHVTNATGELPDGTQTTAYTPIYKYHIMYDNRDDGGYFMFTKGDRIFTPGGGTISTGNASDAFNPSVLSSAVATQSGAYAAMNETMHYAFEHLDAFTQLPVRERMAQIDANKYAISTDYNSNLGRLAPEFNNKAGWVRPYVSFENMHLKNGPRVDAITYGTLVGFDSDFHDFKNGWTGLTTGYIGYNGSQLSYSGVDTTMNGGVLGVTETFYTNNFWTALTVGAGASVGQSNGMYGKEDFTSLMAGVASKTGYNFEFKEGRFIIQPIWQMGYTFVNTFDYTNAAGVHINSDPMHTIQLNPSVRFIANLKNGWQPYASVGMVWNLMNDTNITANGVSLPDMSVKPYVEYGVGVQKRFKDKFTGYLQAMLRNGGRNGIAITGGFRWALGRDGSPIQKVENIEKPKTVIKLSSNANIENKNIVKPVQADTIAAERVTPASVNSKKIIKQLSSVQKTALGAKMQNTTRTTNAGILNQL